MASSRASIHRNAPPPKLSGQRWKIGLAAAAVLIGALLVLWPSAVSRVANLDSRGTTIVAFGDSLTEGYGATQGEDYPSRLTTRIGTTVLNAGVSGDTTESALARVEADVLPNNPRIVIVGLGGNDYLRRVDRPTTEANLRAIVKKLQAQGAMVVLLGFRFPSINIDYEAMYERVADEERCLLIPDLLDGILSDPALRSDAIHPNARGYDLMADRVAEPLGELIEAADKRR